MIELLKTAGAHEVVQHGPTWADADKYLRTEAMVKVRFRILASKHMLIQAASWPSSILSTIRPSRRLGGQLDSYPRNRLSAPTRLRASFRRDLQRGWRRSS